MQQIDLNKTEVVHLALRLMADRYLGFFKAGYQGLTGQLADIQTLSAATGIPFVPGDTNKTHYTVDHSGNLALIGPDGLQYGFLRAPLNVQELAKVLPSVLLSK